MLGFQESAARGRGKNDGKGGLSSAAADLLDDLVKTIRKKAVDGERVLEAVRARYKKKADALRNVLGKRDEFASGFDRFNTSVFATDYTDQLQVTNSSVDPVTGERTETTSQRALTAADMVTASRNQRAKAAQLRGDIDKLRGLGLSEALIKQMQAEGDEAGISALAQGSAADIAEINANNKASTADLGAAGMGAANQLYGDEIKDAKRDEQTAKALKDAIAEAFAKDVVFRLRGEDLVATIRKHDRDNGR